MLRFGNFPLWGRCRPPLYVWPRDIGPPPDPGLRKHAQKLEQDGGGRDAGDAASIQRRRDLDQIGADEIEAPEFAYYSMGKAGSARSEGRATLWLLMATALFFALGFWPSSAFMPSGDPNWSSQLEVNRGRFATTPSEISTRGWKDIPLRVYENIFKHRV